MEEDGRRKENEGESLLVGEECELVDEKGWEGWRYGRVVVPVWMMGSLLVLMVAFGFVLSSAMHVVLGVDEGKEGMGLEEMDLEKGDVGDGAEVMVEQKIPFGKVEFRGFVDIPKWATLQEGVEDMERILQSEKYRQWKPKKGMAFVKTHKTGSSTVTSILHKVATLHGLDCMVPPVDDAGHTFNMRLEVERQRIRDSLSQFGRSYPFDMWVNHVRFSPFMFEIVPSAEESRFSILRDPGTRTRSACAFFHCCPYDAANESVWIDFIMNGRDPLKDTGHCSPDESAADIVGYKIAEPHFREVYPLALALHKKGKLPLLVMERMEESVFFLIDEYGISVVDTTYKSMKVRTATTPDEESDEEDEDVEEPVEPSRSVAMDNALEEVRKLNVHDNELYMLANKMLDERMAQLFSSGEALEDAIAAFRDMNDKIEAICNRAWLKKNDALALYCTEWAMDNVQWANAHRNVYTQQKQQRP